MAQVQAGVIKSLGTGTGQASMQAIQVQVQAPAEVPSSTNLDISAGRGSNGICASTGASRGQLGGSQAEVQAGVQAAQV